MTYTINQLLALNVINPSFVPTARDYARAIYARNKAWEIEEKSNGRETYKIRTKYPCLYALCLQHTSKYFVLSGIPFWPHALVESEEIRQELSKLKSK